MNTKKNVVWIVIGGFAMIVASVLGLAIFREWFFRYRRLIMPPLPLPPA